MRDAATQRVCQIVELKVAPEHLDRLAPLIRANAAASREEPGCAQFDLFTDKDDPSRFILVEIFEDEAALAAHHASAHFQRYVAVVNSLPQGAVTRTKIAAIEGL